MEGVPVRRADSDYYERKNMIEGSYRFSPAAVLPGARRHRQYRRHAQKAGAIALVVILLGYFALSLGGFGKWSWLVVGLAAGATLMAFLWLQTRAVFRALHRQILRSPENGKEIRLRLGPDGITIQDNHSDWSRFREVVVYADGILLYLTKTAFVWLPRSAFADDDVYLKATRLACDAVAGKNGNHSRK